MSKRKQRSAGVSRRAFLKKGATVGIGATALSGLGSRDAEAQDFWDMSADFVSIGAGTAGLAASVSALDHGASVIMVDENVDIGGHGMCSGGQVHLGGGTSNQRNSEWKIRQTRYSWTGFVMTTHRVDIAIGTSSEPLRTRTQRPTNF